MAARGMDGIHRDQYKWIALTNTTLGVFMATINSSIILISLPAIFNGIGINPLSPGNVGYLLWLLQGYLLVTAVLVISLGRLGDIVGRVRIFNLGFAVFSFASVLLALDPMHGGSGALWLVMWRLVQGGGLLSVGDWRLIFWVSVPFGVIGTIWGYRSLRDNGVRAKATIDWWGNFTFAVGLTSLLAGIVYGIQPYGHHSMGWTSPKVLIAFAIGVIFLAAFFVIEIRVESPMINVRLFKIRPFWTGSIAGLLVAIARGGLQFMLIIWLQGIWLPLHGYAYSQTPLWAGIFLVPLTVGFLAAGPLSGYLSDHHGARIISTAGLLVFAGSFVGLLVMPIDFSYWIFAVLVFMNGVGGGMFSAPNQTAVMNSVPPDERGGAAGIQAAFMNSGMVLSIGVFFSLMIVGLTNSLPASMYKGLTSHGVSSAQASTIAHLPAVGSLFSSFLGYNPLKNLLGSQAAANVSDSEWATLTGKHFFPSLIQEPFHNGLVIVFTTAVILSLIAAVFSAMRGKRFVYGDHLVRERVANLAQTSGSVPGEIAVEGDVVR